MIKPLIATIAQRRDVIAILWNYSTGWEEIDVEQAESLIADLTKAVKQAGEMSDNGKRIPSAAIDGKYVYWDNDGR